MVRNEEETVSDPWQWTEGGGPSSGMTFQRNMDPKNSGGTITEIFGNEVRVLHETCAVRPDLC